MILYKIKERFEEMNLFELNDYIESEKRKGSIAYKKYEIEKHKRIAGPVAIIILTFMVWRYQAGKFAEGLVCTWVWESLNFLLYFADAGFYCFFNLWKPITHDCFMDSQYYLLFYRNLFVKSSADK